LAFLKGYFVYATTKRCRPSDGVISVRFADNESWQMASEALKRRKWTNQKKGETTVVPLLKQRIVPPGAARSIEISE